jgi:hypothetical protein
LGTLLRGWSLSSLQANVPARLDPLGNDVRATAYAQKGQDLDGNLGESRGILADYDQKQAHGNDKSEKKKLKA